MGGLFWITGQGKAPIPPGHVLFMLSYHGAGGVLICQVLAWHAPSPGFNCQHLINWIWRCTPVVLTPRRWRQEDQEIKVTFDCIISSRQAEKKITSYYDIVDLVAPACDLSIGKDRL